MAVFNGSVYSKTLQLQTGLSVILPEDGTVAPLPDGTRPVLYLLHGLEENHTCWLYRTRVEQYVLNKNIIVVMPEVQRSFYTDMAHGGAYFTYITQELPEICRRLFPITSDPQHTYIAGLSMGGYGALKCALRLPNNYAAAGSFSGAVDARTMHGKCPEVMSAAEAFAITGERAKAEDDVFLLAGKAGREHTPTPPLYITCGQSDPLLDQNKRLSKQLEFLRLPHVYEEWAGAHNWVFWDQSIRKFLQFIKL